MITQQTVEVERIAYYTDALGYTYCTLCRHTGTGQEPVQRSTAHPDYPGDARHLICDGCSRPLTTGIEIVTGTATIEGISAKIF